MIIVSFLQFNALNMVSVKDETPGLIKIDDDATISPNEINVCS